MLLKYKAVLTMVVGGKRGTFYTQDYCSPEAARNEAERLVGLGVVSGYRVQVQVGDHWCSHDYVRYAPDDVFDLPQL